MVMRPISLAAAQQMLSDMHGSPVTIELTELPAHLINGVHLGPGESGEVHHDGVRIRISRSP